MSEEQDFMAFVFSLRGKTEEEIEKAIDDRYSGVDTSAMKKMLIPHARKENKGERDDEE